MVGGGRKNSGKFGESSVTCLVGWGGWTYLWVDLWVDLAGLGVAGMGMGLGIGDSLKPLYFVQNKKKKRKRGGKGGFCQRSTAI